VPHPCAFCAQGWDSTASNRLGFDFVYARVRPLAGTPARLRSAASRTARELASQSDDPETDRGNIPPQHPRRSSRHHVGLVVVTAIRERRDLAHLLPDATATEATPPFVIRKVGRDAAGSWEILFAGRLYPASFSRIPFDIGFPQI